MKLARRGFSQGTGDDLETESEANDAVESLFVFNADVESHSKSTPSSRSTKKSPSLLIFDFCRMFWFILHFGRWTRGVRENGDNWWLVGSH